MAYRIGSFHGVAVRTRKASVWIRYPITIVLVLLTGWAWQTFFSATGDSPFLIFFPVIFACAALFDRGNGFVAAKEFMRSTLSFSQHIHSRLAGRLTYLL